MTSTSHKGDLSLKVTDVTVTLFLCMPKKNLIIQNALLELDNGIACIACIYMFCLTGK